MGIIRVTRKEEAITMVYITILNEEYIPATIPTEGKIIIKQSVIDKINYMERNSMLSDYCTTIWKEIKEGLAFSKKKLSKKGDLVHYIPTKKERKKRMQRDYIAFYGNQYDLQGS